MNEVFEKLLEQLGTEVRCRGKAKVSHFEAWSALSFREVWAGCGAGPLDGEQKDRNADKSQEWWHLLPLAVP